MGQMILQFKWGSSGTELHAGTAGTPVCLMRPQITKHRSRIKKSVRRCSCIVNDRKDFRNGKESYFCVSVSSPHVDLWPSPGHWPHSAAAETVPAGSLDFISCHLQPSGHVKDKYVGHFRDCSAHVARFSVDVLI